LDDEAWDAAVEGGAVVEARGAEGEEVLGCAGSGFAEDFEFEVAVGCVELGKSLKDEDWGDGEVNVPLRTFYNHSRSDYGRIAFHFGGVERQKR
jgi:hypothetical protein